MKRFAYSRPLSSVGLGIVLAATALAQRPELVVQTGHTGFGVSSVAFAPDDKIIASLGNDGTLKLWSVYGGHELRTISLSGVALDAVPEVATCLSFSADGKMLAVGGSHDTMWLLDPATGREVGRININPPQKKDRFSISSIHFSPDGKKVVSSYSTLFTLWNVENPKEIRALKTFDNELFEPRDVVFTPNGKFLASNRGEDILLWDAETKDDLPRFSQRFKGDTGLNLSFAFSTDGKFIVAGSETGSITVWEVASGKQIRVFKNQISEKRVAISLRVALSPTGTILSSATRDGFVKLWNVEDGKEIRQWKLGDSSIDEIRFSADSYLIAAISNSAVRVSATETGEDLSTLGKRITSIIFYAGFSPDGKEIVEQGLDTRVLVLNIETGQIRVFELEEVPALFGGSFDLNAQHVSPDGRLRIITGENNKLNIVNAKTAQLLSTVIFDRDNWLVTTPDGLFDGTPNSWKELIWRFDNNTFNFAPIEAFFKEFYFPGLLEEIIKGRSLAKPAKDLSGVDIRQPQLNFTPININATTALNATKKRTVKIEITDNIKAPARQTFPLTSGAQDVRLFRNGSLVRMWHGDVLKGQSSVTLEATIPITAGENKLTAYAFNHDNVKSSDATLTINGADSLKRRGVAYVLAVGVNEYANSEYNLKYAVADAQDFGEELKRQQTKLNNYERVEIISLNDRNATKANILKSLADISAKIQPEDALVIFFAGHGTAQHNRFYLIPHDLGYAGGRTSLDVAGLQAILSHSISDEELERAVEGIDAGQLLLVIDACNSGQALESEEKRRGPMNSKGLAQLAYEKGMYILTAAQSYQAAQEAARLGHGFLTYALVEEGLKTSAADRQPKDGTVFLREWLDYATSRVPEMQREDALNELRQLEREKRPQSVPSATTGDNRFQHPRVFYRREIEPQPFVISKSSGP